VVWFATTVNRPSGHLAPLFTFCSPLRLSQAYADAAGQGTVVWCLGARRAFPPGPLGLALWLPADMGRRKLLIGLVLFTAFAFLLSRCAVREP